MSANTAPRFARLASGAASRTCISGCPAFMNTDQQDRTFSGNFGSGICGLKLISIGRPGIKEEEVAGREVAPNCSDYGKQTQFAVNSALAIEVEVAFPDLAAQVAAADGPDSSVMSCGGCANYVGPSATESKIGWRAGFCKAKGKLLLQDRLNRYANRCEYRTAGSSGLAASWYEPTVLEAWSPRLMPEHEVRIAPSSPAAILRSRRSGIIEPDEYETDKPVGPRAKALGVRAWRRIRDQREFGPDIFLPVFDIKSISELPFQSWSLDAELKKVPKSSDRERPDRYIDWNNFVYRVGAAWVRLGEAPALWGPAGVGKTELFRHLAWLMQLPFERVSVTGSSELDDIAGKMMFVNGETTYQYGRVSQAWGKPNVLCIDEPNVGPPDVWQFLRPLTDNSQQLVLDQSRGESIARHTACYLGMAMNPAWDPRNVGANELGDADGSRLMHVFIGYPPKEIERAIILETLEEDRNPRLEGEALRREEERERNVVDRLMKVAAELRSMSDSGALPVSWGIRPQKRVARLKKYMTWPDAFRAAMVDSLEPRVGELIMTCVDSYCPEGE